MTVKCLNEDIKKSVVEAFNDKSLTIDQMVSVTGRSRRTIIRVLEDAGVDPGIHRRPGRSKKVLTEQTSMELDTRFMPLEYPLPVGEPIRMLSWPSRALRGIYRALKNMRPQFL